MCISLFSYGRPVVVRCMGFGWIWVGLGQLFGGLGWAGSMKIDPRTTLGCTTAAYERLNNNNN